MPERIDVNSFENGQEKLQKRTNLIYDEHGNVAQEHVYDSENAFAYTITRKYDEKGCLLSETNALGLQAEYTYDAYGREKSSNNFSNKLLKSTAYDPKGRVKNIVEAGSDKIVRSYSYFHDDKDRLIKKTDNFDQSTTYHYDLVANKPTLRESPQLFTYDGNVCKVIDKSSYDVLGRKITSIDANGNTTKHRYNAYGSEAEIIYPDQSKETYIYAKNGLLDSQTLPNGRVIHYLYDVLGNVIAKSHSMDNELIGKELFEYKGTKLLKSCDLEGHVTHYGYDGLGRKIREERCGCVTTYHYDSLGNMDVICKENGTNSLYTHLRHDLLGRVLEKRNTDSEGALLTLLSYTYDSDGNVQTTEHNINGQNAVDTYTYDSFKREICHANPLGHITTTKYNENFVDCNGQKVLQKTVKDAHHRLVVETYDPYGRVVKIEKLNASDQIISSEERIYDACGNAILHKDHVYQGTDQLAIKAVKSSYDSCNRVKTVTKAFNSPDTRTTEFTYSPCGKVATKTMPDGITLSYSYDVMDNLKNIDSSDGSLSHSFTYNLVGQLLKADDEFQGLTVQRTLDPNGNVISEELAQGINVKKSYDYFNRLLSIDLPDGGKVDYDYDPLFLRRVKRFSSSGKILYEHSYDAYDTSGYLTKESLIAGLGTALHETDPAGQSIGISSDDFTQKNRFDEVGNLVEQTVNEVNEEFGYDDLSQLISETDHNYKYDSTFNRIADSDDQCLQNDLHEQLAVGDLKCAYDLRGNLIEKSISGEVQKFSYDVLNRLIEVDQGNNKTSFSYDPLGRRIKKIKSNYCDDEWKESVVESILYDSNNDVGTLSPEGNLKELRVLGLREHPDKPATVAIELDGKVYAPVLDCQGNVRSLIDIATKVIAASYDYSAFGIQKNANNGVFNPWQYASKRLDRDLSLIDFGKRYYDPVLGRWLTVDPAGFINGRNLYQYNFNNPFVYTDPDGQFVFLIPILCGSFGIGALGATAVAFEIVTIQTVIGAIATGVAIWGISEGLSALDHALDSRRFAPYMPQEANTDTGTRKKVPPFTYDELGDDPTQCPGEGYEWRGRGPPSSGRGSWVKEAGDTIETVHPDLGHPPPIGPHWDYRGPDFPSGVRIYPNNTWL